VKFFACFFAYTASLTPPMSPSHRLAALALCAACALGAAHAADGIRTEPIQFPAGASTVTVKGHLKGDQDVDYLVRGRAGQMLAVTFKPSNRMAYFNVLPPGSEEALVVGSSAAQPNRYETRLPADGEYRLRVYLMRAAARRGESTDYTLAVSLIGAATPSAPAIAKPFDQSFELHGIRFQVTSPNLASGNTVRIVPAGLTIDNSPFQMDVVGVVTGADIADLNVDRSPEIYVTVRGPGPQPRMSLVALAANNRKSLSWVSLPELETHPGAATGYRGGDEMAVVESTFVRRFPLYGKGGDPAAPTGKTRQLQYKLGHGEAGWVLRLDKTIEY
jgi:hypothetical protein